MMSSSSEDYYCLCADPDYIPPLVSIPGTIQATDFIVGDQGGAYYNIISSSASSDGHEQALRESDVEIGCYYEYYEVPYTCIDSADAGALELEQMSVVYIQNGEWLRYLIDVPEAGYYTVSYSLARGDWSGGLTIALLLDDVQDMSMHSSSYDTLCDDYSSMLKGEWSGTFPDGDEDWDYYHFYTRVSDSPVTLAAGEQYVVVCLLSGSFSFNSFTFELSTYEPVSSVPTSAPTSAPTVLDDNKYYSFQFKSTLVDQVAWDNSTVNGWFISAAEDIACGVSNSDYCSVVIDDIVQASVASSRARNLQSSSDAYSATEIEYWVKHILGIAATVEIEDSLIKASDDGSFLDSILTDSSRQSTITATSITTESIGEPKPETSDSDMLPVIIGCTISAGIIIIIIMIWLMRKINIQTAHEDKIDPEMIEDRNVGNSTVSNLDDKVDENVQDANNVERRRKLDGVTGAWIVIGAIRSHLPYVKSAYGLCNEIVGMFSAARALNDNFKKIVQWADNMKAILETVHEYSESHPNVKLNVNMENMDNCIQLLSELVQRTKSHNENNMLVQFALSKSTQELIDEASDNLSRAVANLHIGINIASLGINLWIDENVTIIMSAIDNLKVNLSVMGAALEKVERHIGIINSLKESVKTAENSIESSTGDGEGPVWNRHMYNDVPQTLSRLQCEPENLKILQKMPIGVGGFVEVYKVEYCGAVRTAKIVNLTGLSPEQLQKTYLKFAKELYTLVQLQSPRVVELCGSITSISRLTLILEYMEKGSLRKMLNNMNEWSSLNARQRHTILCDISEGMAFLHENKMYHRDLKSDNVLITDDIRAKLTDFGLSKTASSVSSFTKTIRTDTHGAGTLAWMPPEAFESCKERGAGVSSKHDVYSYGMVTFEVLAGLSGPELSMPYNNYTYREIIVAVLNDNRPKLPPDWDQSDNVYCAAEHASLMNRCLQMKPLDRPTFEEIVSYLKALQDDGKIH